MDNLTILTATNEDGSTTEHILIDQGDGHFVSMPKSIYDAMQAEQSTPNLAD